MNLTRNKPKLLDRKGTTRMGQRKHYAVSFVLKTHLRDEDHLFNNLMSMVEMLGIVDDPQLVEVTGADS